jgi:uncharacterized protein
MIRNPKASLRVKAGGFLAGFAAAAALAGLAHPACAASFDCAKAIAPDERTVCAERALNDQDVRLGLLYDLTTRLVGMGRRGDLVDAQRQFLIDRRACGTHAACIAALYEKRIAAMMAIMATVEQAGPF